MKLTRNWLKDYCAADMDADTLGQRLSEVGLAVEEIKLLANGDVLIDLEVTSNRGDCLGVIGVAREVSSITGIPLKLPEIAKNPPVASGQGPLPIVVEDAAACPRYTAQLIRNVKIGPSPDWLKDRLEAVGIRSINNVVDVTNFVLMEYGQPLHAFDFDNLTDGRIVVRRAAKNELFKAIDHVEYKLAQDDLVICDGAGPVALAGVMGGVRSELTESTVNVLLESASFDPATIRMTSKRHKLASPSSYRFERGTDFAGVTAASWRAAKLILELAGGVLEEGLVDVATPVKERPHVSLRFARLKKVLGIEIPKEDVVAILTRLGFESIEQDEEAICVRVPSFRMDVYREVDLIEEVIRIHGYHHVPDDIFISARVVQPARRELLEDAIQDALCGWGYHEAATDACVLLADWTQCSPWTDAAGIEVKNPIRKHAGLLRKSLIQPLVLARKSNQDSGSPQALLFELGTVFLLPTGSSMQPDEITCAAFVGNDFYETKGIAQALMDKLGLDVAMLPAQDPPAILEAGMTLEIQVKGERIGIIGAMAPKILQDLKLNSPVSVCEFHLNKITPLAEFAACFTEIPRFPPVTRELSLVMPEGVLWGEIEQALTRLNDPLLASIDFLDLFRGDAIGKGKKTVHMHLIFRSLERTLTAEEVETSCTRILGVLEKNFDARLRE